MKAKTKIKVKQVASRCKSFMLELERLCNEYGVTPEMASDNETNDKYIVISIADFVKKEDIKMKIEK